MRVLETVATRRPSSSAGSILTAVPDPRASSSALLVRPSGPLSGRVRVGGAKNSVLKLMAASLLAPGRHRLRNVPGIADVAWMAEILEAMGARCERDGTTLTIDVPDEIRPEAPYELVERLRASIVVLGPLLARCGEARVALPGGDDFGPRPIDMHLRGLEQLGAGFETAHGYVEARAPRLTGRPVLLEFPSVGATENVLMAAVRAEGTTVIENAAREPEIADLAAYLNRMGATVVGAGSATITVEGVGELHASEHEVIPDRIEAATYLAALGVAGGELLIEGARPDHMDMLRRKLGDMGLRTSPDSAGLWAMAPGRLRSVDVSTLPYPGLATDYKPLLVAMLSVADGVGIVTENLFSGRFRYVDELKRMGADIRTEGHHAVVRGQAWLSGAPVRAHDIRAGAALVVAGLRAEGETLVADAYHLDRGYEDLVAKLRGIGADVSRLGD
jgi:UDP-N-acetylglucosamine 1-carboxyvinyltransferase